MLYQWMLILRQNLLNKLRSRGVPLALLGALLLISGTVLSQSYSTGYKKYVKGDFAGAENAFRIALNKNQSDAEKARLYKMIGISQYMQGKRIAAESSFQQAKAMNPYINISASEVLDDSIIQFFNTVKAAPSKNSRRAPVSEAATTLKIYANVPRATVTVDGVRLGVIGKPLKVSPGIHEVTVDAPGYQSVSQPMDIKSGEANNLSINLKKAEETKRQPAPIPKPVAAPKKDVTEVTEPKPKKEKIKKSRKKPKISKSSGGKKALKKRRKRRKKPVKSESSPISNLAPFGIPQYMNDSAGLGIVFTSLQAGGLIYGVMNYLASEKLVEETNTEISRRDEVRVTLPSSEQQQDQADAVTYQEEQQAKIDKLFVQQWIGFGTFGIAWACSTIEAFISGSKKSNKPSRRANTLPAGISDKHLLAAPEPLLNRPYETRWRLQLTPLPVPKSLKHHGHRKPVLGLNLHIKF